MRGGAVVATFRLVVMDDAAVAVDGIFGDRSVQFVRLNTSRDGHCAFYTSTPYRCILYVENGV